MWLVLGGGVDAAAYNLRGSEFCFQLFYNSSRLYFGYNCSVYVTVTFALAMLLLISFLHSPLLIFQPISLI